MKTNPSHTMKSATHKILLIAAACCCASCASNEELQHRMDKRNDAYSSLSERREIRADARQERTDMWFESKMH